MLAGLFGSVNRERVLLFILCRQEGNASQIARFYKTNLSQIQKQLNGLEESGVLVSRMVGRTRLYTFNPRYSFLDELKALLDKSLKFYPDELRKELFNVRLRPRRRGKPL